MEAVGNSIKVALPYISDQVRQEVLEKLEMDGVLGVSDLQFVVAQDLNGVLKPIEIRKLLKEWSNAVYDEASVAPAISQATENVIVNVNTLQPQIEDSQLLRGNQDPNWPYKLSLPWDKLPREILHLVKNGERLVGKPRRKLIHIFAEAIQTVSQHPLKTHITIIAQRVYNIYPNAVIDKINQTIVGRGYETFVKQLVTRCENVNRKQSNPLTVRTPRSTGEDDQVPTTITTTKKDAYGCVNWQPVIDDDDLQVLESKQEQMKQQGNNTSDADTESNQQLLKETYALQRRDINAHQSIGTVVNEWPLLFSEMGLFTHFNLLTDIELRGKMVSSIKDKASRLFVYSKYGRKHEKISAKCRRIFEELNNVRADTNSDRATILALIQVLMANFSEKESTLFCVVDEHTMSSDIETSSLQESPQIVACGDSLLLSQRFMLAIDRTIVVENITSTITAISLLFASFYCFNIEYPEGAAATLEFIQRCFAGINPGNGGCKSQGKRKRSNPVNSKLLAFTNELADFEWVQSGL